MVLKLSTGKSSKILIHGTSKTWHIPHDAWKIIKENHYEWTAHSHPTMTKIIASPEDRETLKLFTWQEKSIIIDLKGNTKEFTASTQDWINEILGVTGYDKREKATNIAGQRLIEKYGRAYVEKYKNHIGIMWEKSVEN